MCSAGDFGSDSVIDRFFQYCPDLLCITSNEWDFVKTNPGWKKMLGYETSELDGKSYLEFVHPDDIEGTQEALRKLRQDKEAIDIVNRYRHKDGTYCWLQWHTFSDGDYMYASARDISAQKNSEETIRKSEKKYRMLFENMTSSFALHKMIYNDQGETIDYVFVEINPVFEKYVNKQASEIIGKSVKELYPKTEDSWIHKYGEVVKTGIPANFINYSVELNKYLEAFVFKTEEDQCASILIDVSDRIKKEKILNKFKASIDYALDGIYWINQEGGFDYVNGQACQMLGYRYEELIRLKIPDLDPAASLNDFKKIIHEYTTTKVRKGNVYESIHKKKNGSIIPVEVTSVFVWLNNKAFLISYVKDISERKQYEETLKLFKKSIEMSNDLILWHNKDAGFDYVNDKACKSLGYTREELMKLTLFDIDPVYTREEWDKNWNSFQADKNKGTVNINFESIHKRKDGSTYPVEISGTHFWIGEKECNITHVRDISDRKQYETILLNSQKLLNESQRIAQMGSWEVNLEDNSVHWSKSAYILYGVEQIKDDLSHEQFLQLIHPDDRHDFERKFKKAIIQGKIDNSEFRIIRPDGEIRDLLTTAEVIKINDKPVKIIGITKDITAIKKAEEALKASEQRMHRIYEFAPVSIGLLNKRIIIDVNSRVCNLTWYKKEELIGKETAIVFPSKSEYKKVGRVMYGQLEEHGFGEYESRWKRKDGKIINVYLALTYLDPKEPSKGVLFTALDISKIKETERLLTKAKERAEESEFFLKESQRTGNIGSYKMNFSTGEWISTEILDNIFGIDHTYDKNVAGWLNLVHPDDRNMMADYLQSHVIDNLQPFVKEYRIIRKTDNETRWLFGMGKLYFNDKGNLLHMFGTIQDITERKLIEEERWMMNLELENRVKERTARLHQANKDLESFAYSVSHDLRAPLRHINGFMSLLVKAISPASTIVQDYVDKIFQSLTNMSAMINELLQFSRLGRADLNTIQVNLSHIVEETIARLMPDCAERNIQWNVGNLPVVKGDPRLLKIAFENLISNAIKYTSKKEQAVIEISEKECKSEHVCISIKDNGTGFNMAYKDKLFGVFQRLHKSEEFEGIGIGLAHVKQIIEKHNGKVDAESETDKGATFYITLPKQS